MDDDLVKRLRENHCPDNYGCNALPKCACADLDDAADAIEHLSAENAALKHEKTKMQEPVKSPQDVLVYIAASAMGLENWQREELKAAAAHIVELEKEKANFHMQYRMKCDEETKRLELRIAALESGQPVEHGGEPNGK